MTSWTYGQQLVVVALFVCAWSMFVDADDTWDGTIVQYGKMHEAIGNKLHGGRVELKDLVKREHFYAVGALEKLVGEITVFDGKPMITRVDSDRKLQTELNGSALQDQATLLVGAYVPLWQQHSIPKDLTPQQVEAFIEDLAATSGINTAKPFPFVVAGELADVRLHVINGACPMHARLNKLQLPSELQPVEIERKSVRGTLIGIFAKESVGNVTHPATSSHTHVIVETASSENITGHVERFGLAAGAIIRLPIVEARR